MATIVTVVLFYQILTNLKNFHAFVTPHLQYKNLLKFVQRESSCFVRRDIHIAQLMVAFPNSANVPKIDADPYKRYS
jgi:hypothetical protein